MWVARDKNKHLRLYESLPSRKNFMWISTVGTHSMAIKNLFPELTWKDEPIQVELDTRQNLIKRFEILHMQYELTSREFFEKNPGKGFMSFDEYAMNNWDKVDMNYFDTIM